MVGQSKELIRLELEKQTMMVSYKCFDCLNHPGGHIFKEPQASRYPSSVPCIYNDKNTAIAIKSRWIR